MTTIEEADKQRAEILKFALQHDPGACWVGSYNDTIEPDENCLLVTPDAVLSLIEQFGETYGAYEDPNPPGATDHTRVVFPKMSVPS